MKKPLVLISLLVTFLNAVISTKQTINNYEIPAIKIKVDHKKYLENIVENIKESLLARDRATANSLTSWSKNYIQEFKKIQKENFIKPEKVVNITKFTKFIESAESYLNNSQQDYKFNHELEYLELRINNFHNNISKAIESYSFNDSCNNKDKIKSLVKEYDQTLRNFAIISSASDYHHDISLINYEKFQDYKRRIWEIKKLLIKYIQMILDGISSNLTNIKKKISKDIIGVDNTEIVNNLHEQYLNAKEQIEFLQNEKIASEFSYKINLIDSTLVFLEESFKKSEKQLIVLWKKLFNNTKVNLLEHAEKIETEGEWEKIEVLLESFKTDVKKYLEFKNKNQDLALEHKEVNCLINEIRSIFVRIKYLGITKDERHGTWSQWYLSEPAWNSYRTGAKVAGVLAPWTPVVTHGVHRFVVYKLKSKIASTSVEIVSRTGTRTFLNIIGNKIYLGAWIGTFAGLGLFSIPAYCLNFITTHGAGLSFKYNYLGYASGMLAPSIEIRKTAKPQNMKYLNVWDVEEIKSKK